MSTTDITLYDRNGEKQTFESIDKIVVDTPKATKGATFTYGEPVNNAEYEPNFANGDYAVSLEKGKLLKEFTIKKPETLLPENIVKDVDIAGVVGSHTDDTKLENLEIELSLSDGDQSLSVYEGYVVKSAIIKKPETLIPENIRKNTSIAGITGTLSYIEEVETEEAMNVLLVAENVGNAYRFIGETTENYVNGDIYIVEESA